MNERNYSWLALVTVCAAVTLVAVLGIALLLAGGTLAFAGQSSRVSDGESASDGDSVGPGEKFSGVITDSRCGARHVMDSGKNASECAVMCVHNGSKYALVDGDRRYFLTGNRNELDHLAGQRAMVSGTLHGNTILISSISAR